MQHGECTLRIDVAYCKKFEDLLQLDLYFEFEKMHSGQYFVITLIPI